MPSRGTIQQAVDFQAECFNSGRLGGILHRYAHVLPVYMQGNLMTLTGRDQLRKALQIHREKMLSDGVVRISGKCVASSIVQNLRYRIFVDWTYEDKDGRPVHHSHAVYYCLKTPKGTIIEMIDYTQLAYREAADWYQNLATAKETDTAINTDKSFVS